MRKQLAGAVFLSFGLAPGAWADFDKWVAVEPGGILRVEVEAGRVEVESHGDDVVHVVARSRGWGGDRMEFRLVREGRSVRFEGSTGGWGFGSPEVDVRLRVPEEFSADIRTGGGELSIEKLEGDVRARTGGGKVEVDEILGLVDLETSGGHIKVSEIEGGVRARTSGGHIEVDEVEGPVDVETSGGHLKVREVTGPVAARTSGGHIEVRFTDAPAGDLETSGGQVEVEFPEGEGFDLDAETSGGRIELDAELALEGRFEATRARGRVNGGGLELRLRTSGGNIKLRTN